MCQKYLISGEKEKSFFLHRQHFESVCAWQLGFFSFCFPKRKCDLLLKVVGKRKQFHLSLGQHSPLLLFIVVLNIAFWGYHPWWYICGEVSACQSLSACVNWSGVICSAGVLFTSLLSVKVHLPAWATPTVLPTVFH